MAPLRCAGCVHGFLWLVVHNGRQRPVRVPVFAARLMQLVAAQHGEESSVLCTVGSCVWLGQSLVTDSLDEQHVHRRGSCGDGCETACGKQGLHAMPTRQLPSQACSCFV
jgi:hypothetical protein